MAKQNIFPNSDITEVGGWAPIGGDATIYECIDDTGDGATTYVENYPAADDGDYFDVGVPYGSSVTGKVERVTVVCRGESVAGITSHNIEIKINGSWYPHVSLSEDHSNGLDRYFTFYKNPATNQPWTANDINGVSIYGITALRFVINDASPAARTRVTSLYILVEYDVEYKDILGHHYIYPETDTGNNAETEWRIAMGAQSWYTNPRHSYVHDPYNDIDDVHYVIKNVLAVDDWITFGVPKGDVATGALSVTANVRCYKAGTSMKYRCDLKIDSTWYNSAEVTLLRAGWGVDQIVFATNPATGLAWTKDDINGTGAGKYIEEIRLYVTEDTATSAFYISSLYLDIELPEAEGSMSESLPIFTLSAEGFTSSGNAAITFPQLQVSGSGYGEYFGESDITLPFFSLSALATKDAYNILLKLVVDTTAQYVPKGALGIGQLVLPLFTLSIEGIAGEKGQGEFDFLTFSIDSAGPEIGVVGDTNYLPQFIISGTGSQTLLGHVDAGRMVLGLFDIEGQGFTGQVGSGNLILPSLRYGGIAGGIAELILGSLTAEGIGLLGTIGTLETELPFLTVVGHGTIVNLGIASITLPSIALTSETKQGFVGAANLQVEIFTISSDGIKGQKGIVSISLPMFTIDTIAGEAAIGTASISIPMITMQTSGDQALEVSSGNIHIVVINAKNLAPSEYNNYPFESMCKCKDSNGRDVYIGAVPSGGIFNLAGSSDNGTDIASRIRWGRHTFGVNTMKRIPDAYVDIKADESSGSYIITLKDDDDTEYEYPFDDTNNRMHKERVKLGKGMRSEFYTAEFRNVGGSDFELRSIELDVRESIARKS